MFFPYNVYEIDLQNGKPQLTSYLTGNKACWEWFLRLEAYTRDHFVDEEYGEWFGYLNREGTVNLDLKGGKWKGCFHVPRGLLNLWQIMEALEKERL